MNIEYILKRKDVPEDVKLAISNEIQKSKETADKSKEKFEAIFENTIDGILLADVETKKFVMGNDSISSMLGYSKEELMGLGVLDIHPKDELDYVLENFEKQTKGEITLAKDMHMKRKNGSVFYADVNSTTINIDGKICQMGMFRDITERRENEEKLKEQNEYLNFLFRLTRHDIRNRNAGIEGFLTFVLEEFDKPSEQRDIEQIIGDVIEAYNSSKTITEIIENVSTLSGLKEKKLEVSPMKLYGLINGSCAISRRSSSRYNKEININCDKDSLDVYILGNPILEHVFCNLIENSIKYGHDDSVNIDIYSRKIEDNNIEIIIEDDGPGIRDKLKDKIFGLGKRGDISNKPGSGLGLYIVEGLIQKHDGEIHLEDKVPGDYSKGCKFKIKLPYFEDDC